MQRFAGETFVKMASPNSFLKIYETAKSRIRVLRLPVVF